MYAQNLNVHRTSAEDNSLPSGQLNSVLPTNDVDEASFSCLFSFDAVFICVCLLLVESLLAMIGMCVVCVLIESTSLRTPKFSLLEAELSLFKETRGTLELTLLFKGDDLSPLFEGDDLSPL
jgi:hypothetical protein